LAKKSAEWFGDDVAEEQRECFVSDVGSGLRNSVSETEWVALAQEVNLREPG
jgi:hypothetical protein